MLRPFISYVFIFSLLFMGIEGAVDSAGGEHPHGDDYSHVLDSVWFAFSRFRWWRSLLALLSRPHRQYCWSCSCAELWYGTSTVCFLPTALPQFFSGTTYPATHRINHFWFLSAYCCCGATFVHNNGVCMNIHGISDYDLCKYDTLLLPYC